MLGTICCKLITLKLLLTIGLAFADFRTPHLPCAPSTHDGAAIARPATSVPCHHSTALALFLSARDIWLSCPHVVLAFASQRSLDSSSFWHSLASLHCEELDG